MKKEVLKKLIFSIASIVLVTVVIVTSAFAWFTSSRKSTNIEISGDADISLQGYILKYYESDVSEGGDIFVSEGNRYPIDMNDEESLVGDEGALDNLDNNNYLKFIFVITNNNKDFDCNISFRLSDFSTYIFSFYEDYVSEYNAISSSDEDVFTKRNAAKNMAKQYNAKFSLYFSEVSYCVGNDYDETNENTFSKGLTMTPVTLNKDPFLWNYSSGDRIISSSDVLIPKDSQITLTFKIKTQQSNESINSYRNWITSTYGRNYLSIHNYDKDYASLTNQEKKYIDDYINYFVNLEISTIFSENSSTIQETKLLIDYFEFIGETASNHA